MTHSILPSLASPYLLHIQNSVECSHSSVDSLVFGEGVSRQSFLFTNGNLHLGHCALGPEGTNVCPSQPSSLPSLIDRQVSYSADATLISVRLSSWGTEWLPRGV